jgi:hypothetical protein
MYSIALLHPKVFQYDFLAKHATCAGAGTAKRRWPVLDDSPGKTPSLNAFYHPHSWHCDRNCNTATVFPFDRTNPTLREKGGGGKGCLYVGNLATGDKKTAPNAFHSEPFFRLRSFFNFVTFHP